MNALGVYYIQPKKKCLVAARQQGTEGVLYTYIGVGLSALLVSTGWQCEGLLAWDERQVQFPRFFVVNLLEGDEGEASIYYYERFNG